MPGNWDFFITKPWLLQSGTYLPNDFLGVFFFFFDFYQMTSMESQTGAKNPDGGAEGF